ncbi:hypothetical protein DFH06DRAFT_1023811, partial [Mycena polygramma]
MLIWLEGHLSPQRLRDELIASDEFKTRMFRWLETTIKSEMMSDALNVPGAVDRLPVRMPHEPNPGTLPSPSIDRILNPTIFHKEYVSFVDDLLLQYNWHEHRTTCWKYLKRGEPKSNENCRMGMTGETHPCTSLDPDTFGIVLRRLHPWIASYNDLVMFLLKCNIDIKFVGSGEAAKAFLYYVTDYITKPDFTLHVGLAALAHAINSVFLKNPSLSLASDAGYVSAVTTSVNSMMGFQEISHPQVMSHLIGGGDHYSSHKFSVLYWSVFVRFV